MFGQGLVSLVCIMLCCAGALGAARRQPLQMDKPDDSTDPQIRDPVELILRPTSKIIRDEGESVQLECTIRNKPEGGQIQWYYIVRGGDGTSFDNFTILANEVATIDTKKYHVWTTPGDIYSIRISDLTVTDSGEYCCFLFVSYDETYRKLTELQVNPKRKELSNKSRLDQIIEEAVEHDIEEELGSKLNITQIKNNEQAKTLIHNATEEIKSLLNIDGADEMEFQNASTRYIISRKMKGVSSQVKTVVTSLLSKISTVDSDVARILQPSAGSVKQNGGVGSLGTVSYAGGRQSNAAPDWRTMYKEYKKQHQTGNSYEYEAEPDTAIQTNNYNAVPNTPPPYIDEYQRENIEEQSNTVEIPANSGRNKAKKCEYQIVINEFDPSQCPSISNGHSRTPAAAMYYEADNRRTLPAESMEQVEAQVGTAVPSEQLTRLENRLMDEMVNNKMVNQTVKMHDDMLQKTEKMLEEQTTNLTKLEGQIASLESELKKSESVKENMEQKLTEVMINLLEVNKRLDIAMRAPGAKPFTKIIDVESASETIQCERHPNVTHHKDCSDAYAEGNKDSGVYYIRPLYSACPIPVWCDMDTYPGGWTVIQRREDGKVNFNRNWSQYRQGFGEVTGDHWLGNDNLFLLTNQAPYMMRIDLWDFYNSRVFAEYKTFKIDGERDGYKLTATNYSGTAGDGLKSHNKLRFSTRDKDHDMWDDYHCAQEWEGGWWFTNCWSSYLNGAFYNVSNPPYNGISWREWKEEQLSQSEMKIRPTYIEQNDEKNNDSPDTGEVTSETKSDPSGASMQGDEPRHDRRQKVYNGKLNMATVKK